MAKFLAFLITDISISEEKEFLYKKTDNSLRTGIWYFVCSFYFFTTRRQQAYNNTRAAVNAHNMGRGVVTAKLTGDEFSMCGSLSLNGTFAGFHS